jgi:CHAT domain-containing protein
MRPIVRHPSIKSVTLVLLVTFLLGISGCKTMLKAVPEKAAKIELKGPYDGDMPERLVIGLKDASAVSGWAVPHIFISVGMYFESLGDETRAIHFLNRSISEFRKLGDTTGEGTALNRKIFTLCKFGKMQDAYNTIKEVEKNWLDTPLTAFIYHNYGHYFLMNGDYDKALEYFRKSFSANTKIGNDFNLLMLQRDSELEYGIAVILADYLPAMSKKFSLLDFDDAFYKAIRQNIDEGISHLNRVIVLNNKIRLTKIGSFTPEIVSQIIESKAYGFLGLAYGIKGQFAEAMKHLESSAQLARKANFRIGEVDNLFFRSLVYLLEKNINEGFKASRQFNDIVDKYHLPFYQISAKFILSHYYLVFDDTLQAISLLHDAVAIMEKQPSEPVIDSFKETSMFNQQTLYEALIDLLAKEGDYKGAFEIAERAKSKVLIDLLAGIDIGKTPIETELIKQNNNYVNELADGYRKLLATSSGGDSALRKALDKIEKTQAGHRDVIDKIKRQNEELYSLLAVESLDNEDVRRLLDKNTTLFSYYVSDKILYIWAVNKDRVHLERIKIDREYVSRLVNSFRAAIASKNKKLSEEISEKVYEIFLKPVIPFVSGDWIGFIPHGPLCYLPFAAMSYKGQYLADSFSIFYLPWAGVLKYEMKKQPSLGLKVLAFGNPDLGDRQLDLPYAEAEVGNIKKAIPHANIYLRARATKKKAMEMLDNYDIVHFAARGVFVSDLPLNSGLLLAAGAQGDGRLTTAEIFKLRFKGRMIVTSADRTQEGISFSGVEIVGLNRAFLYTGSPSVVTTLWNIEDKSIAIFMSIFYKNLKKNESVADSLKETQAEMIRRGYAPYDWAAYILTGIY